VTHIGEKRNCGACDTYVGQDRCIQGTGGRRGGKRPLGRYRQDNIKIDLHEVGWGGMDWFNVAQDRDRRRALVNAGNFVIR